MYQFPCESCGYVEAHDTFQCGVCEGGTIISIYEIGTRYTEFLRQMDKDSSAQFSRNGKKIIPILLDEGFVCYDDNKKEFVLTYLADEFIEDDLGNLSVNQTKALQSLNEGKPLCNLYLNEPKANG